jgi:rSAM/selenodomain-associated transferase 1
MEDRTRAVLAIVCRNPEVGRVKTRLIPALGEDGARALYRAFLQDLGLRFADRAFDLLWAYTPEGGPPPPALTPGLALAQEGPNLGHRLLHIFRWATAYGYERVVVISSDVPHLPCGVVDAAFAALATDDVVLAPSEDGGYHLVGMSRPHDIFTMLVMSTPEVLAQTGRATAAQRLSLRLLEGDFDVDLPKDLARLAERLGRDRRLHASHTARMLRQQHPAATAGDGGSAIVVPAWCGPANSAAAAAKRAGVGPGSLTATTCGSSSRR